MNDAGAWTSALAQRLIDLFESLAPTALLALSVLVLGLFAIVIGRSLTASLVRKIGLEALAERFGISRILYALNIQTGLAQVCGNVVAVGLTLVTGMALAEIVGLPGVAEGIASVVEYIPRLVTAFVVIAFGFAMADIARRLATGALGARDDLIAPGLVADTLYYLILAVFLTSGLTHLGLPTQLVDLLITVTFTVTLTTAGLAIALGSRQVVQNAILRGYAQANFDVGDALVAAEHSGTIVQFGTISLTLHCEDGTDVVLPYTALFERSGARVQREP